MTRTDATDSPLTPDITPASPAAGPAEDTPESLRQLDALLSGLTAQLAGWAERTTDWLGRTSRVTSTSVDKFVRPAVETLLQQPGSPIAGAGFIATLGLLAPDRSYMAWWQGDDMERVDALANFSPQPVSRYMRAEWFRVPVSTGKPHVTGPYIDLLCTDEYVCTFTYPVFRLGAIAGIVGMDVTAQKLELMVLPLLRQLGPTAAMVNQAGRAVVAVATSTDAGDAVRAAPGARSHPVGGHFTVLTAVEPAS
ncbi:MULTISPECIES: cache domain-containing protein [Arthrobacter]|uniref:Cache domain-containing protein n=2 Tax=Arthrobacter TaxID=1663 RepID=A0ABU9KNL8_9MICC|nr:cache domain-containing protein [Arthrobacter sp. YJM1]MDP5228140.1 cache domain-containing protein [Arthrobacter sp. YJM1]